MCTVSIVPRDGGFRLVCNRDERRDRPLASSPAIHSEGGGSMLWPVDQASGGTWVGVTGHGLAAALLNRHPAGGFASPPPRSRGTILPELLTSRTIAEYIERAAALNPRAYAPFTVVAIQRQILVVASNGEHRVEVTVSRLRGPTLFTSSSLGDRLVDGPRRRLFARLVVGNPAPLDGQASFHRHRWPRRPAISVVMSRADAATVSRTEIDATPGAMSMRYEPI